MLLWLVVTATPARAFAIAGVESKWQDNLEVEVIPDTPWADPQEEISAARGEQVHLAYWLINDTMASVTVTFTTDDLHATWLPERQYEVRVLTWHDVIDDEGAAAQIWDPGGDEAFWLDADSDHLPDRGDWENVTPHVLSSTWYQENRSADNDGTAEVILTRAADPLPLMKLVGEASEELEIPSYEARILWLTITVPHTTPAGAYAGTPVTVVVDGSTPYDLDLTVNVPCWDTLDRIAAEPRVWDYSYEPMGTYNEGFGIEDTEMSDARAERRGSAGYNTTFYFVGEPSRADDEATTTTTEFDDMVASIALDLESYDPFQSNLTSTPRGIQTVVLAPLNYAMFGTDWGASTSTPALAWSTRYADLLVDLEAGLYAEGVPVDEYQWVLQPVDEPIRTHSQQNPPTVKPVGTGSVTVSALEYFKAAVDVIRDFSGSDIDHFEIMLNHPPPPAYSGWSAYLDDEWEQCRYSSDNCVDIWMSHSWMPANAAPQPHALDGVVSDAFWWYTDQPPTAMRQYQAAWPTFDEGITGSSLWGFWSANTVPYFSAPVDSNNPVQVVATTQATVSYEPHSWIRTKPYALWNQHTLVYFDDDSRVDEGAHTWVPTNEVQIPGRELTARRQGLEAYKVRDLLDHLGISTCASLVLDGLVAEAIHPCHVDDSCDPPFADPDDLMLVMHTWLDGNDTCTGQPPSTTYTGEIESVENALATDPWSGCP